MLVLLITVLIFNFISFIIPKKMSAIEILSTTLFATFLQLNTDIFLDLKYDLYGYFKKGVDWGGMIYIVGIFPAVNVIFLNYFPYQKRLFHKILYIFGCTVLALLFELLFLWSGTFYYSGWKLWYSAILYPFLYLTLILFHRYTHRLRERAQK